MKSVKKDDKVIVKKIDFKNENDLLNIIKDYHDQSLVNPEDENVIRLIIDIDNELSVPFYYNIKDLQSGIN